MHSTRVEGAPRDLTVSTAPPEREADDALSGLLQTLRDVEPRLDDPSADRTELTVDTQGRSLSVNEAGRQMDCLNRLVQSCHRRDVAVC